MQPISNVLKAVPAFKFAALSDSNGNVTDSSGTGEVDVLCAVAAMCNVQIDAIGELLGGGPTRSWSIVTDKMSVFVHVLPDGFVAGAGDPSKSPENVLKALAAQVVVK